MISFFKRMKDGGPASRVWGFFLIEWKRVFSIALLKFEDGSREAFHTHAFNAWSWVLKGELREMAPTANGSYNIGTYWPSISPVHTPRDRMHKVVSVGTTWALTFRGPWRDTWWEYIPAEGAYFKLTHGREVLEITRTPPQ